MSPHFSAGRDGHSFATCLSHTAPIQPSQWRHAPQSYALPTTSPAEATVAHGNFSHGSWHANDRAGLRAPHPRAGPAPPPRTGRDAPMNPRMLGQEQFRRHGSPELLTASVRRQG
ncbi:MAG: hypothetical protein MI924_17320 [Chloroflexales bacterium]|nr:hypothetical protein [Chloroflexales bacterium]